MEKIVLKWIGHRGTPEEQVFPTNTTKIDLSFRHIRTIELKPLSMCSDLQHLDLSNNFLESIDLWPLMKCTALRSIELRTNRLTSIEVTPLTLCPELEYLGVDGNVEIIVQPPAHAGKRRPPFVGGLRRSHVIRWTRETDEDDPMLEIERIKNSLFSDLATAYCSPDQTGIVDEFLRHYLVEELSKRLEAEASDAEKSGDFRKAYTLRKGLSLIRYEH
ncbi:MAG: hypothetical protein QXS20_08005 [Candidatus Thorarchaeota archaeon]